MANDSKTFRLLIDADPRLAAAAGGVARYLANTAGLESEVAARLQTAVIAACSVAFEHLIAAEPHLQVTFTRRVDLMEVALSHRGDGSPAVGLDTIAGFASPGASAELHPRVFEGFDRVQYETRGSEVVTRLIKYLGDATSPNPWGAAI